MSKYGDMVALLDWAMKMKDPKPTSRKRKAMATDLDLENLDLAEVYLKLDAREKKIKASKEAIEKMMKKEEKKPEKNMDLNRLAFILVATFPITGPLYFNWLRSMLH